MAEFVFTSPGYKFKERDLTYVTRNVGITTLGLVGETLKGPAFEKVFIQDKNSMSRRFGGLSAKRFSSGALQYQLPYVANSYLNESNQLWVTRVLGLSGYDAGKAWAITLNAGIDPTTIVVGASTSTTASFTDYNFLGVAINASGDTGTSFSGFTKTSESGFTGVSKYFECTAYNPIDGSGTVSVTGTTLTGSEYTAYKNMVLALVRSRGTTYDVVNAPAITRFETVSLTIPSIDNTTSTGIGNLLGTFKITAVSGATSESYVVTMNPNASSFLPNVIGSEPKDKATKIWVESVYPDLIKKLDGDGDEYPENLAEYGISGIAPYAFGINSELIQCTSDLFTNYKTQYQTPETPWVVSQIKGNAVSKLFKFVSISDGNAANQEIKISIQNINPITLEFDVAIRDFNDSDANPIVLEMFSRCGLIKGNTNYIGQRIGTIDGEYDLKSEYIMIEMADDITITDFPAGFEGYLLKNYSTTATGDNIVGITPKIFYKTKYNDDERTRKVYLGLSEHGYDAANVSGTGINQNLFNFTGKQTTNSHVKSDGFHMDIEASGVTSNGFSFQYGDDTFQGAFDVTNNTNKYYDINTRKFTFVPAGGFDGWDVNRIGRSHGNLYRLNGIYDGVTPNGSPVNDYQAWQTAINTFANAEEVTINLFATPNINWSDNTNLIQDTIEMIENDRADSLYIIDAPDVNVSTFIGDGGKADVLAAQDITSLLSTADIDSSYACTYFPWIQMRDTQNNVNVYLPPTCEVVSAMAYTDKVKFPWFAPAGITRGATDARKSKYKLSQDARDILYAGRINPMTDFAETGTAILGQKTLQKKATALDRINVRRLLLQIKVLISNIAIRMLFEQNDQTTVDQFTSKVRPILDTIKRERGLFGYDLKMDDSNNTTESRDRNELYGEIFLQPTRSLEFIGMTFTITPSGASFSDIQA